MNSEMIFHYFGCSHADGRVHGVERCSAQFAAWLCVQQIIWLQLHCTDDCLQAERYLTTLLLPLAFSLLMQAVYW
jgi:hypothetical protein